MKQEEIGAALKEYFELLKTQRANESRLAELKGEIRAYMEAEGYDRVFGEDGYLSRSQQKRYQYDFAKVRGILEPLGKWEEVLAVDESKLRAMAKTLPPQAEEALQEAKVLVGEYTLLVASRKRVPPPPPPHGQ